MDKPDDYQQWLAQLPDKLRPVAEKYPLTQCYRSTQSPRFHYWIHSVYEDPDGHVRVRLTHGRDSAHPGVSTFGQDPAQLIACGCGQWQPPTDEQCAATRARLEKQFGKLRH